MIDESSGEAPLFYNNRVDKYPIGVYHHNERYPCGVYNSSLARETWREICVSVADIFHMQISAHPRGAFISVGDCNPD